MYMFRNQDTVIDKLYLKTTSKLHVCVQDTVLDKEANVTLSDHHIIVGKYRAKISQKKKKTLLEF